MVEFLLRILCWALNFWNPSHSKILIVDRRLTCIWLNIHLSSSNTNLFYFNFLIDLLGMGATSWQIFIFLFFFPCSFMLIHIGAESDLRFVYCAGKEENFVSLQSKWLYEHTLQYTLNVANWCIGYHLFTFEMLGVAWTRRKTMNYILNCKVGLVRSDVVLDYLLTFCCQLYASSLSNSFPFHNNVA